MTDPVAVLLAAFVLTQSLYFVVNVLVAGLLYIRPVNRVSAAGTVPTTPIRVLVPVYRERREILRETLDGIQAQDYPDDLVSVFVLYEKDDPLVGSYLDDLRADVSGDVTFVPVNRDALAAHLNRGGSLLDSAQSPRTKAAALTYGFISLSFDRNDVIAVFDSDTQIADDFFRLAVAGLESYDVVQAKQTVRNIGDGWLPALEAMGIAAWSHLIYAHTSKGPYQLLGKGYCLRAKTLNNLREWDVEAVTEDMSLGLAASAAGCELGIIDRYVQDLCPANARDWVTQKRRWVRGPYGHLFSSQFAWRERLRFWTFTVANQLISLTNVAGIPVGIAVLVLVVTGHITAFPGLLTVLVLANLLSWSYYAVRSYVAADDAIRFESTGQRVRYFLRSNPFTQLVYATIWVVPICLAVWDVLRGKQSRFEVTPK